jgi:hypothetical protein
LSTRSIEYSPCRVTAIQTATAGQIWMIRMPRKSAGFSHPVSAMSSEPPPSQIGTSSAP